MLFSMHYDISDYGLLDEYKAAMSSMDLLPTDVKGNLVSQSSLILEMLNIFVNFMKWGQTGVQTERIAHRA